MIFSQVKNTAAMMSAVLLLSTRSTLGFSTPTQSFQHRTSTLTSLRRTHTNIFELAMAGKDSNDGNKSNDPNPGGMSEWGDDDDNNKNTSNENFLDTLKAWFTSDLGKEDIQTYTLSLGIALLLRLTIIEPRYIPSLSMYPTFDVGDQLAVEKVTKRIRPFNRNEVVVFNPPDRFREIMVSNYGGSNKKTKEALIKRIVAVEVSNEMHFDLPRLNSPALSHNVGLKRNYHLLHGRVISPIKSTTLLLKLY
jgi:hypothetical protein